MYFFFHSLVSGDVKGNFKQLFSRVSSIIKKNGEFDVNFLSLSIEKALLVIPLSS